MRVCVLKENHTCLFVCRRSSWRVEQEIDLLGLMSPIETFALACCWLKLERETPDSRCSRCHWLSSCIGKSRNHLAEVVYFSSFHRFSVGGKEIINWFYSAATLLIRINLIRQISEITATERKQLDSCSYYLTDVFISRSMYRFFLSRSRWDERSIICLNDLDHLQTDGTKNQYLDWNLLTLMSCC